MTSSPKVLIIQTAFLGDVILALPVVQTLKNVYPESEMDFLCIPSTQNVLQNNPAMRNIIVYDKHHSGIKGLHDIIHTIRNNKYDIVLCPHRSFRSAMITFFSGAKVKIGFDRNSFSFLLTHKVHYESNAHEVERDLSLVKAVPDISLNKEQIELRPKLFPSKGDDKIVSDLINLTNFINLINLVTLSPCSKWFTKQLTKQKTIGIINELIASGYTAALIGGSEDVNYCREVEKEVNNEKLLNFCGKLTPLQSYLLISKASVHISVDSAAAHLASAAGTPIVQIYGSTVPAFGFYPLTSKHIVIENLNLDCRPCTDHGRTECPLKHFRCIEDLNAKDIVRSAMDL
ncbi:MAG: glycosyltransferase family 9 protein [Ignavibacteriae bacterium]|nr:MAG: glycosyltransferase family 9 protein [Ignavibacteriota bacterium]